LVASFAFHNHSRREKLGEFPSLSISTLFVGKSAARMMLACLVSRSAFFLARSASDRS
jgi:hypothetical protein